MGLFDTLTEVANSESERWVHYMVAFPECLNPRSPLGDDPGKDYLLWRILESEDEYLEAARLATPEGGAVLTLTKRHVEHMVVCGYYLPEFPGAQALRCMSLALMDVHEEILRDIFQWPGPPTLVRPITRDELQETA